MKRAVQFSSSQSPMRLEAWGPVIRSAGSLIRRARGSAAVKLKLWARTLEVPFTPWTLTTSVLAASSGKSAGTWAS
jgi:hypothetical protein